MFTCESGSATYGLVCLYGRGPKLELPYMMINAISAAHFTRVYGTNANKLPECSESFNMREWTETCSIAKPSANDNNVITTAVHESPSPALHIHWWKPPHLRRPPTTMLTQLKCMPS